MSSNLQTNTAHSVDSLHCPGDYRRYDASQTFSGGFVKQAIYMTTSAQAESDDTGSCLTTGCETTRALRVSRILQVYVTCKGVAG